MLEKPTTKPFPGFVTARINIPADPTDVMVRAGIDTARRYHLTGEQVTAIWRAMHAAATKG